MVAVVYLCEIVGGAVSLSHEVTELAWCHIGDVDAWHANHGQLARRALAAHRRRTTT